MIRRGRQIMFIKETRDQTGCQIMFIKEAHDQTGRQIMLKTTNSFSQFFITKRILP